MTEGRWTDAPPVRTDWSEGLDFPARVVDAIEQDERRRRHSWLGLVLGLAILVAGHAALVWWVWPWVAGRMP